jgi:hypothetical protein
VGNQRGQIGAYHGSPHKFDRFEAGSKIGTGEGAQAFGHGLYFTNEKDIARHYAKYLGEKRAKNINNLTDMLDNVRFGKDASKKRMKGIGTPDLYEAAKDGNADEAVRLLQKDKEKWQTLASSDSYPHKQYANDAVKEINSTIEDITEGGIGLKTTGSTYSVTLHKGKKPDQYDYLKWDKPVSESVPEKIAKQFVKEGMSSPADHAYTVSEYKASTGAALYRNLSQQLGSDKAASEFLLRAGIDGIDYPAGSISGVANSKARNYVVFDPAAVTIESVEQGSAALPMLGITGGVAGGALTLAELLKRMNNKEKK